MNKIADTNFPLKSDIDTVHLYLVTMQEKADNCWRAARNIREWLDGIFGEEVKDTNLIPDYGRLPGLLETLQRTHNILSDVIDLLGIPDEE